MMFSATFSPEAKIVCRKFMKNPFEVFINEEKKLTLVGLRQYFVKLEENEKIKKL
jgi:ATP-dependent RNA helicase UAP56/SUB2